MNLYPKTMYLKSRMSCCIPHVSKVFEPVWIGESKICYLLKLSRVGMMFIYSFTREYFDSSVGARTTGKVIQPRPVNVVLQRIRPTNS